MMRRRAWETALAGTVLALVALGAPSPAAAHCDSMDGPVVTAAREALAAGEVTPVLMWVRPGDEPEIRRAFQRTLAVRSRGEEARELADLWFFETLVRIHREGEGAPYTGLKPAGHETSPAIEAADRALETAGGDALVESVGHQAMEELRARYERVVALREFAPDDVEAGRAYVHAYVDYIHFVERLHALLTAEPGAHGG